jgi:hypothetical protein
VTQASTQFGAFLEVDGGDRATATTTSETLTVQGTTDGSGHITLRFGVTDAGGGASGDGQDPLDYTDQPSAEADGWVVSPVTGVGISFGYPQAVNGHSPSVQFVVTGGGGSLNGLIYKDYTLPVGSAVTYSVGMLKGAAAPWFSNAGVYTITGGVQVAANYSSTTGYGARTIGADGVLRIVLAKGQGGPYVHASEDYYFANVQVSGAFGGGGAATFGLIDYCEGSGPPSTPPGIIDPPPDPPPCDVPPCVWPPPPVGGARPFGAYGFPPAARATGTRPSRSSRPRSGSTPSTRPRRARC